MYQSTHTGAQVDEAVDKALGADATPTPSSTNLVESGGVASAVGAVSNAVSRRNLLDNPWFTVNQRGLTSYAWNGVQYAIDRWKWDTVSTAPLEVQSDGVNLNASAISAGAPYMRQIIDNVTAYRGKKLTFSALVSSVSGASNIGYLRVYAGSGTQWGTYIATGDGLWSTTFTVPSDASAFVCDIGVYSGKAAKVVAAKLEVGSTQTLAHNEGTADAPVWVLNEIPSFAEELLKCQRYFVRISGYYTAHQTASAAVPYDVSVPFPVQMRAVPTISNATYVGSSQASGYDASYSGMLRFYSTSGGFVVASFDASADL